MRPTGLEPVTNHSEDSCSIHLSYGRVPNHTTDAPVVNRS